MPNAGGAFEAALSGAQLSEQPPAEPLHHPPQPDERRHAKPTRKTQERHSPVYHGTLRGFKNRYAIVLKLKEATIRPRKGPSIRLNTLGAAYKAGNLIAFITTRPSILTSKCV